MEYQTVETFSQTFALIFFFVLFIGVCIFAFWPGNKKRFKKAAELPLNDNAEPKVKD